MEVPDKLHEEELEEGKTIQRSRRLPHDAYYGAMRPSCTESAMGTKAFGTRQVSKSKVEYPPRPQKISISRLALGGQIWYNICSADFVRPCGYVRRQRERRVLQITMKAEGVMQGNPHVRFDEGEVAPAATPRRGSLLYKLEIHYRMAMCVALMAAYAGHVIIC